MSLQRDLQTISGRLRKGSQITRRLSHVSWKQSKKIKTLRILQTKYSVFFLPHPSLLIWDSWKREFSGLHCSYFQHLRAEKNIGWLDTALIKLNAMWYWIYSFGLPPSQQTLQEAQQTLLDFFNMKLFVTNYYTAYSANRNVSTNNSNIVIWANYNWLTFTLGEKPSAERLISHKCSQSHFQSIEAKHQPF